MGLFKRRKRKPQATVEHIPTRTPHPSKYAKPDHDGIPDHLELRHWDYGAGEDPESTGYGFTHPNGKPWPANNCGVTRFKELGVLVLPVVGLNYHQQDANRVDFDPGRPVHLVAEPDNPHDPKAIGAYSWDGTRQAGYIRSVTTSRLRNLLRGQDFRVMILNSRHEGENRASLKVVLWRPGHLTGAEHTPPHPPIGEAG